MSFGITARKTRSARAGSNLVQHTEAAKRRRWNVEQRAFPGHVLTTMLPRAVDSSATLCDSGRRCLPTPPPLATHSLDGRYPKFPWIRRLAADYAFAYPNVAPFFAGEPGDSRRRGQTRSRRSQATARRPAELARVHRRAAGAPRRARTRARGGRQARRSRRRAS